MKSRDTLRAKELFLEAVELEETERERFLEELGRDQPAIAERVRRLLDGHERAGGAGIDAVSGLVKGLLQGELDAASRGTVLGDYELLEELASGSAGIVWRARQISLDRVVAVKVLRAGRLAGTREVQRFRTEAGSVAKLNHPNVVPVYEIGEHEGCPYFSMRWIEGGSLATRTGERWGARRASILVRTIARAVHYAHQRGLLHRDLKPSNVLLDEQGEPHVADFGIAKRIDGSQVETATRGIAGTPAYMAPEQTSASEELTVATDVWALGCIYYELLIGRPPFEGGTLTELLQSICTRDPRGLRAERPDLPADLETIVLKCLRKDPEERYPSANALADDVQRWLDHEPILARRPPLSERLYLYWRRSPLAATLGLLVALLVLTLAVGASWATVELRGSLRDSWLGEARATRLSGVPGRRRASLDLVARAARIRPGPELRDEAIACLALTDVTVEQEWRPRHENVQFLVMDRQFARWAWVDSGWNVHAAPVGQPEPRWTFHTGERPAAIKFSPDGSRLGVRYSEEDGGPRARFRVLDCEDGRALLDVEETIGFSAYGVDPAGGRAAVVTMEGTLIVYDLASTAELLRIDVGWRAGDVMFSPDGGRLAVAVGGDIDEIQVRSSVDGRPLEKLELPGSVFWIDWTADGTTIVAGCDDFRAYVWELGTAEPRAVLAGHAAEVVSVFASSSTPLVATYGWDETSRIWDRTTGEELVKLSARPLCFQEDGARLAFRTNDTTGVWKLEYGSVLRSFPAHGGKGPKLVRFTPDSRGLSTSGDDGALLWDVSSGRTLGRLSAAAVKGIAFHPDGERLFLSGADGLRERRLGASGDHDRILLDGPCDEAALTPGGEVLVVRQGERLHVFRPGSDAPERTIAGRRGIEQPTLSPDGGWLATATWKGFGVPIWDVASGDFVTLLHPDQQSVTAAFSPDGTLIATGTGSHYHLHEVGTWRELHRFERDLGLSGGGGPLAFAPDGSRFAAVMTKETIGMFDPRTGESRGVLEAPRPESVASLGFSPDGTWLAVGCRTNRLQIWDLEELARRLAELGLDGD